MEVNNVIAVRKNKQVYREGDECFKVFDDLFSKSDILNEALNQARVEETGLNIPKIRRVTMIDGKWAIVSDYIPGKTLATLMEENPDKYDEYLEYFVDLQIKMHTMVCPLLNKLKDKMTRKIMQADLDPAIKYELHTRLEGMETHTKLCHGDFNPSNIIISDDGKAYIIDWSHATQGNASADVARTYLVFCLNGEKETADKYLDMFCKKTNTAKDYVQNWMPIVAASQSVKGHEDEKDFLMSWVNVIE